MENMSPTLWLILSVRKSLEQGHSIFTALQNIEANCPPRLKDEFQNWKWALEKKQGVLQGARISKSIYREFLYRLLELGLRGESIHVHLVQLQEEIEQLSRVEIDMWIGRLPFLLLIPLMFFQFPALVLVTLGPFFMDMLNATSGHTL